MAAAPSGAEIKELQDCPSAFSARDATPHHGFWVFLASLSPPQQQLNTAFWFAIHHILQLQSSNHT